MLDSISVADNFAKLESLRLKLPRGVCAAGSVLFGFFHQKKGMFLFLFFKPEYFVQDL